MGLQSQAQDERRGARMKPPSHPKSGPPPMEKEWFTYPCPHQWCGDARTASGETYRPRKVWSLCGNGEPNGFSVVVVFSVPVRVGKAEHPRMKVTCPVPSCGYSPLSGLFTEQVGYDRNVPRDNTPSYVHYEVCHVCGGHGFVVLTSSLTDVSMPRERETIPFAEIPPILGGNVSRKK